MGANLSDYARGIIGVVRLWANTSATTQFLPPDLACFVQANNGIRIELEERNSSEIVHAVLDGRATSASASLQTARHCWAYRRSTTATIG